MIFLVWEQLPPSPAFPGETSLSSARELGTRIDLRRAGFWATGDEATGTFFSQLTFGQCVGSRDGAVVRALTSHQCGPGSIPARRHMWLSLLLVLALLREFFSGDTVFLPPRNPTSPNSNSTRIENAHENQ